jgi:hypothetical protein
MFKEFLNFLKKFYCIGLIKQINIFSFGIMGMDHMSFN